MTESRVQSRNENALVLGLDLANDELKLPYVYAVHNNLSNKMYTVHNRSWTLQKKSGPRLEKHFVMEICGELSWKRALNWRAAADLMR